MKSIEFINELAKVAERLNHHPDMVVGWCKIDIYFTSHDLGGVSEGYLNGEGSEKYCKSLNPFKDTISSAQLRIL